MKKISVLLAALAVTAACDTARTSIDTDKPDAEVDEEVEEEPKFVAEERFGAALIDGLSFVDFNELIAVPEDAAGFQIETIGTVRQSCQTRGCWMSVRSSDDANSEEITVRFKDYAFFMPFNSRGAEVRFQGELFMDVLTPSEAAEMRAEGYELPAAEEDGTVKQLLFMANGVEMAGRDQTGN